VKVSDDEPRVFVCQKFFTDLFQVHGGYLTRVAKKGSNTRERAEPKAESVRVWFTELEKLSEYQPDTMGSGRLRTDGQPVRTGVLISYARSRDAYDAYVKSLEPDPDRPLWQHARKLSAVGASGMPAGRSTFMNVWKREFKHVKLRKHSRFAKCDTCVHLREMIRAPAKQARGMLSAAHAQRKVLHLEDIKKEREYYHNKRQHARENPTRKPVHHP